jgi:type I restriction enzyme S subunit
MTAAPPLDLADGHRRIVLAILHEHLPSDAAVWVFGSRATGQARRYSDLDLVVDVGRPLTLDETGQLREALSGSDLPYRVDIIDWHAIGDGFRSLITATRRLLSDTL